MRIHFINPPTTLEEFKERGKIIDQAFIQPLNTSSSKTVKNDFPKNKNSPPKCKHCKVKFHFFKDCPKLQQSSLNLIEMDSTPVLPRINIRVNNETVPALIDSGAFPNYLRKDFTIRG